MALTGLSAMPWRHAVASHINAGYHFMNQLYVYWEATWLEKA
jgi:hypothetical protein